MTLKLAALKDATSTVEVAFRGSSFDVEYRVDYLTPAREEEFIAALESGQTNTKAMLGMLAGLLVSWDILDADGEQLGCDVESMAQLPSGVLIAVFRAVQGDLGGETGTSAGG